MIWQTVCYQIKNKFSTLQMREKVSLLTNNEQISSGSKMGGLLNKLRQAQNTHLAEKAQEWGFDFKQS